MIKIFIKKNLDLRPINNEKLSQLQFQTMMIKQKVTANRPIDHKIGEIRPNYSIITEKNFV